MNARDWMIAHGGAWPKDKPVTTVPRQEKRPKKANDSDDHGCPCSRRKKEKQQ